MAHIGKLTRESIVHEATVLLDEGGIGNVSLRRIANRLGTSAPALARHVGDKAQLLALLSARIFGEALDLIPSGLTGDAWLHAFGHALRLKQARTRDIFTLISVAAADGPLRLQTSDRLHAAMAAAGLHGARAELEQNAIQALVTGWTTLERNQRTGMAAPDLSAQDAFDRSLKALVAGFAAERG
jgi:AcrR family transcriptional regulator